MAHAKATDGALPSGFFSKTKLNEGNEQEERQLQEGEQLQEELHIKEK